MCADQPLRDPGTGRIAQEVGQRTRRIIYGDLAGDVLVAELTLLATIDRAHLVMLLERGIVGADSVRELLRCIDELESMRFEPLLSRSLPRGVYLMYEGYLAERLGSDVAGVLQTGRSRNDLKAAITCLQLRDWLLGFAQEVARLEAILLSRAREGHDAVMPLYTHFQAAMPASYGYYLLGVARAVCRETDAVLAAAEHLRVCPLGVGAVAGTNLPIDPDRVASLLGFGGPAEHALDTVASRDGLLRMLAAVAGLTVTLSRLATDLQLWSSAEFDLITLPDRLVGGSSAMPQKRNAFLLEHVRAKSAQAIGAWTAAASSAANVPFTNSIEVGTEAVARCWPGLRAADDAIALCQVLISGARPRRLRMMQRAEEGFTGATALANQMVQNGVPFRTAHHMVGEAVREALAAGSTDLARFGPPGWLDGIAVTTANLAALVETQRYGGGPGASSEPCQRAIEDWQRHVRWHRDECRSKAVAAQALASAVSTARSGRG